MKTSVMKTSAIRVTVLAGVVLALGLTAGCSSGQGSGTSSAQAAGAGGAAGLPTSTAGVGSNGSVDARVCAAIAADIAAITKNVSNPATFPGQCAFGRGATTVSFNLSDPQHSAVTTVISTGGHAISGIGDGAVWFDSSGQIVPSLGAWKGNVSCLIQPDSEIKNDTVKYAGSPPFTKISDADAAAYAQKMGKVCIDVFAAAS